VPVFCGPGLRCQLADHGSGVAAAVAADRLLNQAWAADWATATTHRQGQAIGGGGVSHWAPPARRRFHIGDQRSR
jgi:hypothetical protein